MYNKLFSELINTRKKLPEACWLLGVDLDTLNIHELDQKIMSCADCGVWRAKAMFVIEAGAPVCSFCQDMYLLRF